MLRSMEPDPRIYAFEKPIGFGEFQKIVSPLSYSYRVPLSVPYWNGSDLSRNPTFIFFRKGH